MQLVMVTFLVRAIVVGEPVVLAFMISAHVFGALVIVVSLVVALMVLTYLVRSNS
jgi:hypothetical protein